MEKVKRNALLAGAAAGVINGFFGGGGGMILVPMLTEACGMEQKKAFATSVAVILPLCMLSSVIYFCRGDLELIPALPYLIGGLVGGFFGGKFFKRLNTDLLRRLFALLLLYGGIRSLFF